MARLGDAAGLCNPGSAVSWRALSGPGPTSGLGAGWAAASLPISFRQTQLGPRAARGDDSERRWTSTSTRRPDASPSRPKTEAEKEKQWWDHAFHFSNHIWSEKELKEREKSVGSHIAPKTAHDTLAFGTVRFFYHAFNLVTGYTPKDPSVRSVEMRLIVLESVAGVPGFLAAAFKHFSSLRRLSAHHELLFTSLEEAENERMHLLTVLEVAKATWPVRALVVAAQLFIVPFLGVVYTVNPASLNRFVAYLEETAVRTYSDVIAKVNEDGTRLNAAWADLPAPDIAKAYWRLDDDAMFVDVLRHILADEAHHRDVNHCLADLKPGDPNPLVDEHRRDFDRNVRRRAEQLLKEAVAPKD